MKYFLFLLFSVAMLHVSGAQFDRAIEQVAPAVVFIAGEINGFDEYFHPDADSYVECLRPIYEWLWPPKHHHGSGFIVSPDGYVVTNAHVVQGITHTFVVLVGCDEVRVRKATCIGLDERTDLAVLKIEIEESDPPLPYVAFGDSDQVKIGQEIAVIGNPLGVRLQSSVSTGVVSGRERVFGVEELLQTDAAANPGNSGGPMIDVQGRVVGVISSGYFWFDGLNFAVPSQIAKKVVDQLITNGEVISGYLGIELAEDEFEEVFDVYSFGCSRGAWVEGVAEGSPAQRAGVREGDCIVSMDGHPISSARSLQSQLAVTPPRYTIELLIARDDETFAIHATLADDSGD